MKILLTGGAGYIGSHAAVTFLDNDYDIVVADNYCNSKPEAPLRVQAITGKEFPVYKIDIRNIQELRGVFEKEKIDAVVHFAGLKAVGESCAKPLLYYRNNIDATLSLIEVMKEYGVNNIVFSSSATVYGVPESVPIDESAATWCTNPYGWTKYMIEQILRDEAAANPDLSVVLLRYFNPIGAHESGKIGEDPQGIPNNLMPFIAQVAVGKRKELSVFGNDYPTHDGTGVRDYIHVMDLAEGHVKALEYAANHKGTEVFNLGTGTGYSVLDIVKAFEKANNVPIPYVIAPRRDGDVAEMYANPHKAEAVLGWKAKRNLTDMCRDTWNWQKHNPNGYQD